MERALIIGCGYTGTILASRLHQAKIPVVATTTTGDAIPGATVRPLDLLAPAPLSLPEADGAVVYYMVSTLSRHYDAASRPHLQPMARVLAALEVHRPAAFIYLSSTSVFGDRNGAWVTEDSEPAPQSPWGHMRLELEALAREHGARQGWPVRVARLPEIYGPGRGPIARLRRGYRLRFPDRFSNRIHVEDLADVLSALGQRPAPELLLVSDDEPAPSEAVYALAARLLDQPPPPRTDETETDLNRLALMRDSKRCDNQRLRQFLTRPLRYPTYREGLPTTV